MSDYPPPPPAGGPPPPPPPPPPPGNGGYGGYGAAPQGQVTGVPRPGELLDRFLARLIDGVIFGIVYGILAAIFAGILVSDPSVNLANGTVDNGSRFLYNIVISVLTAAVSLGYYAFLESTRGQTVGKMVMKLRVYGPDGHSNPTLAEAAKRNIYQALNILGVLGVIGSLLSFVGAVVALVLLVMGINSPPTRQTWFDKFAGGCQVMKIG